MATPKLRFKEFDGDWEVNTIQYFMDNNFILDQMDGNHGELYPKSEEFSSFGVPYVSATDFSSGIIDFSKCKRLPLERAKLFKKGIAKNGDVLFAHNATVGPVAILETELDFVILSTTATYYRCDGNFLNNYYLKNYFESDFFVQQYFGIMSQSTRNQVPITTQRKLSISIPIIKEQTKIASFLSAVDEKISQLTQKHELLSQYKQGMMQKLFSQQIRFIADDDSEFGEWEYVKIGKYIKEIKENSKIQDEYEVLTSSRKGLVRQAEYFEGSRLADRDNIGFNIIHPNQITYRSRSDDGLFFFNMNNLGITGIISTYYPVFTMDNGDTRFLAEYLNFHKQEYIKYAVGTSQLVLSINELKNMKFHIPCSEEQTKIANFLSAIDQKIKKVAQQIEETKQWKKGLLQQMFV